MSTLFQGVEKQGAAFRLMQQMGWEEGSGLGKDKQGMKQHLRVRNKQDSSGIGIDQEVKAQALWKVNTMEYDNVLKKLKVVVGQAAEGSEEKDSGNKITKEVEATHSELLKVIKATRPQGRYKKREMGKMVENYSKNDLAAILGGVEGKIESEQIYQSNKVIPGSISPVRVEPSDQVSGDVSSDSDEEDLALAAKEVCSANEEPEFADLRADWWGNKFGFVRSGRLGASSGTVTTERAEFHEKDQEDLAILAHQKATKGKQGLGASDRIKVGKAGWKGQRKTLDLESDEDNDAMEETSKVDHKESTANTRCENNKKQSETPTKDTMKDKSKGGVGKTKTSSNWKKVCEQLLREAPLQTLSLKRLEKRFCSTMLSAYGTEVQLDKDKLQKSSRFSMEGKKVTLSSK